MSVENAASWGSAVHRKPDFAIRPLRETELDEVTAIYVETFPHLVCQWYASPEKGTVLYRDMMYAFLLANPNSFFVAESGAQIAGYLLLRLPHASVAGSVLASGFWKRIVAHAMSGKYGFPWRALRRVMQTVGGLQVSAREKPVAHLPHVEVIVVRSQCTGKGIGRALLERARAFCVGKYDGIWLHVEQVNEGAIRFYERIGFKNVAANDFQRVMKWEIDRTP